MSKTKTDDKNKLESKLKTATGSDNEIIDGLIAAIAEKKAKVEVKAVQQEKKQHPLIQYYKRGRSINQLAGMFMITEAEVRKIIDENV